jgi:hypothetical protein
MQLVTIVVITLTSIKPYTFVECFLHEGRSEDTLHLNRNVITQLVCKTRERKEKDKYYCQKKSMLAFCITHYLFLTQR